MPYNLNSATPVGCLLGRVCAAVLAVSSLVLAEEPDGVPTAERAARLVQTKRILDALRVYPAPDRKGVPAKRTSEPVLRYTDSTRQTSDSTLWIWGATGRPAAMASSAARHDSSEPAPRSTKTSRAATTAGRSASR